MFTLKLYRLKGPGSSQKMVKVLSVHHVVVMDIGNMGTDHGSSALELQAFQADNSYETYFVGTPEKGMDAFGRDDLHLDSGPGSWWKWGILENSAGKTTEYYRPAGYLT